MVIAPLLLLGAGCSIDADRFVAFQVQDDGSYRVQARRIESLEDPLRMTGELGEMRAGGVLSLSLSEGDLEYRGGRGIEVLAVVQDGVAEPIDLDGLILYSFYGHLQDARDALLQVGVDVDPLFPVSMAVTPAVPDIGLALLPVENAAYAPTANTFVLLSDLTDKQVPLAANAGVVAHETGHGVFHLLTTGDPYAPKLFGAEHPGANGVSSLDEGFADMLGGLITGDPRFIVPSLNLPSRDLESAITAEEVGSRPELETQGYDPYALGSVFAATAWDIRLATNDIDGTLLLVCDAVVAWAEAEADADDAEVAYRYLDQLVALGDPAQKQAACAAVEQRFAGVHSVQECL